MRYLVVIIMSLFLSTFAHAQLFTTTTLGLCISGENITELEKRSVDTFAIWACSHYTTSFIISNGSSDSRLDKDPADLLKSYRRRFLRKLQTSGLKQIDIFILGHNNSYDQPLLSFLKDASKTLKRPVQIRFVYNSGCFGNKADKNLKKFARTYIGHNNWNYGPIYSPAFLGLWFKGVTAETALRTANKFIYRRPFTTTDAAEVGDAFWRGIVDWSSKEDNDPRGWLTGVKSTRLLSL